MTPGELCKITAQVLGIPEAQTSFAYRVLREADLVSRKGRGPAAPKSTPRDAAILLTAILGSNQIGDAATTVRRYGKANALGGLSAKKISEGVSTKEMYEGVSIAALTDLPADHSFIDALTAFIAAAAEGKLLPALRQDWPYNKLTVTVRNPATVAKISVAPVGRLLTVGYSLGWPDVKTAAADQRRGDLEEFRQASTKTFLYIGAALAGKLGELPALEASAGEAASATAGVSALKSRARSAQANK